MYIKQPDILLFQLRMTELYCNVGNDRQAKKVNEVRFSFIVLVAVDR